MELERAGHRFSSRADTEVLVHGYEEWGDDFLARVDGMFAFALWDFVRERLLLARDRMGKKPLYYALSEGGLAFGSDARSAHLVTGRTPSLDRTHVADFLFQRYVCSPHTLFAGVQKLPPAACAHLRPHARRAAGLLEPRGLQHGGAPRPVGPARPPAQRSSGG